MKYGQRAFAGPLCDALLTAAAFNGDQLAAKRLCYESFDSIVSMINDDPTTVDDVLADVAVAAIPHLSDTAVSALVSSQRRTVADTAIAELERRVGAGAITAEQQTIVTDILRCSAGNAEKILRALDRRNAPITVEVVKAVFDPSQRKAMSRPSARRLLEKAISACVIEPDAVDLLARRGNHTMRSMLLRAGHIDSSQLRKYAHLMTAGETHTWWEDCEDDAWVLTQIDRLHQRATEELATLEGARRSYRVEQIATVSERWVDTAIAAGAEMQCKLIDLVSGWQLTTMLVKGHRLVVTAPNFEQMIDRFLAENHGGFALRRVRDMSIVNESQLQLAARTVAACNPHGSEIFGHKTLEAGLGRMILDRGMNASQVAVLAELLGGQLSVNEALDTACAIART